MYLIYILNILYCIFLYIKYYILKIYLLHFFIYFSKANRNTITYDQEIKCYKLFQLSKELRAQKQ